MRSEDLPFTYSRAQQTHTKECGSIRILPLIGWLQGNEIKLCECGFV